MGAMAEPSQPTACTEPKALCELAYHVTTKYFVFTDAQRHSTFPFQIKMGCVDGIAIIPAIRVPLFECHLKSEARD